MNTKIDMPKPIEIPTSKNFSIPKAVAKLFIIAIGVLSIMFTASAVMQDTVLQALERNYASVLRSYEKQKIMTIQSMEMERSLAEQACDAYGALKGYKNSKSIQLTNDGNPCVEFQKPYIPEIVPGAEGVF